MARQRNYRKDIQHVSVVKCQVSSLKLFYSKKPILGLTQELCWVRACIGSGVAFETIKLSG